MVEEYILTFKNFEILSLIEKSKPTQSSISRKLNITYSWVVNLVQQYESLGLVSKEKKGRISKILLTEKGKKFNLLIQEAKGMINYETKTRNLLQESFQIRL